MIETERLILRPYREDDRPAFAALNGHPEVGDWLGGALDPAASDTLMDRVGGQIAERGFGFWGAERRADGRLVGMIGLLVMGDDLPAPGAIELGWRLHPDAQGSGLATEGALAARDWAFTNLDVAEVVAITAHANVRSQAVMRKLGMTPDPARDFDHPRLAQDHPLRRHVFFTVQRPS
ncbi:GNAT family N-acetyltransferase [Phenylobacterium sp.]|uniref:GNAT family N-acetyltransferase n=1 Tax=Phenylobacterium sp. TaxID=1871053 RepID=UPI0025DCE36E|nr:GNAT family N-acetyltransferase [Phenylobacterium sp.]